MMISFKIPCTIIVFVYFMILGETNADCSICSAESYAACVNRTSYRMCLDGKTLSNQIGHCTGTTVCTDTKGICQEDATGVVLGCSLTTIGCGKCSGVFSCLSVTDFAYCSTQGNVIATGKCEDNKICSIEKFSTTGQICVSTCENKPTCPNTEFTTTAPPVEEYASTCAGTTANGFYPKKGDTTCTKYVYCELAGGTMNAVLYTCSNGYFDPVAKKCGTQKPTTPCG